MKCQVLIRFQRRHIRPVLLFLRLRLPMLAHQDSNFTQPLLRRHNLRLCKTPIIGLEVVDFKLTFPHSRILFPIPRNFLSLYFFHRQVWFFSVGPSHFELFFLHFISHKRTRIHSHHASPHPALSKISILSAKKFSDYSPYA